MYTSIHQDPMRHPKAAQRAELRMLLHRSMRRNLLSNAKSVALGAKVGLGEGRVGLGRAVYPYATLPASSRIIKWSHPAYHLINHLTDLDDLTLMSPSLPRPSTYHNCSPQPPRLSKEAESPSAPARPAACTLLFPTMGACDGLVQK